MNLNHRIKITSALAYFDVFNYPLNFSEIERYTSIEDQSELSNAINSLIDDGLIFRYDDYYTIQDDVSLVTRRLKGNKLAEDYLGKATKNAKLIAKFPYVKGVYISGSLSKGYMSEDGDVDYFIITAPNRLWVARTLLILYKKVFLLNSRKYFCVNYFIDEENLEIEQKNIFTATELVTLMPMTNAKLYKNLLEKNAWLTSFYANATSEETEILEPKRSVFQKMTEPFLGGSIGTKLDHWFMKITLKKWFKKFKDMSKEDFEVAMKSTRKVSKHHPSNFQKKVLEAYEARITNLNENIQHAESTF